VTRRARLLPWLLLPCACGGAASARVEPPRIHAAASVADVVTQILRAAGVRATVVPGASSTLARQIEQGAPADAFLSAHQEWIERLIAGGHARPESRRAFAANRLVFVAPAGRGAPIDPRDPAGWPPRIALGDPAHVPAGRHAREAFDRLGIWDAVAPRVVAAADVRGALALVARGEVELGVVYATDAKSSAAVEIVATFPPPVDRPIRYEWVALVDATAGAESIFAALSTAAARDRLLAAGFVLPDE
jgi:molybdate transport system substrate-binding protein